MRRPTSAAASNVRTRTSTTFDNINNIINSSPIGTRQTLSAVPEEEQEDVAVAGCDVSIRTRVTTDMRIVSDIVDVRVMCRVITTRVMDGRTNTMSVYESVQPRDMKRPQFSDAKLQSLLAMQDRLRMERIRDGLLNAPTHSGGMERIAYVLYCGNGETDVATTTTTTAAAIATPDINVDNNNVDNKQAAPQQPQHQQPALLSLIDLSAIVPGDSSSIFQSMKRGFGSFHTFGKSSCCSSNENKRRRRRRSIDMHCEQRGVRIVATTPEQEAWESVISEKLHTRPMPPPELVPTILRLRERRDDYDENVNYWPSLMTTTTTGQ